MDLAPLNLRADTDLISFNLRDYEEEEDSMNTYKVVRALNHIVDVIYDTIDALIAEYDIEEEEE